MTNKEWLSTLDDETLAYLILYGLPKFSRASTSSSHYIKEWLGKEYTDKDMVVRYFMEETYD